MWFDLTGRLAPVFRTIADLRRDKGAGIRNLIRRLVHMCRELEDARVRIEARRTPG